LDTRTVEDKLKDGIPPYICPGRLYNIKKAFGLNSITPPHYFPNSRAREEGVIPFPTHSFLSLRWGFLPLLVSMNLFKNKDPTKGGNARPKVSLFSAPSSQLSHYGGRRSFSLQGEK